MSSFGRFFFGALLGGAVGAFIGMLLAPRSGEETRKRIQEDLNHYCEDSVAQVKGAVHEQTDALKERVDAVGEQIKDSAVELREKAVALSDNLEETGRKTLSKRKIPSS